MSYESHVLALDMAEQKQMLGLSEWGIGAGRGAADYEPRLTLRESHREGTQTPRIEMAKDVISVEGSITVSI